MTIQECYAQMGADYNEVFRRLYNEAMIRKFVRLFPKDDSFHNLEAALKEQNVKEAFRAAHTLKGVCQNLGFSNLYAPAVTLTETLRAGQLEGTAAASLGVGLRWAGPSGLAGLRTGMSEKVFLFAALHRF